MIEILVNKHRKQSKLSICAKIPDDYPITVFAQYCFEEHEGCFAHLEISLTNASKFMARMGSNYYEFPWKGRRNVDPDDIQVLFLHEFYVHSQDEKGSKLANLNEKQMMKGVGKRMLCTAVQNFAEDIEDVSNTYIVAEADGYRNDIAAELRMKYHNMNDKDLLMFLFTKFPSELQMKISWMEFPLDVNNIRDDLLNMISNTEANSLLVDYYMKTYGFSIWQKSVSTGCLLGTDLETILQKCS